MRFTEVLYKVNYHRHFKRIWKRQGKLDALELQVPEALKEMGVVVEDAKEILNETKFFPPQKVVVRTRPTPPSLFDSTKYFYLMNNETQVTENENQMYALTKTIPYSGLPAELTSQIGRDCIPNQDELVQTNLRQAMVWDSDQKKLPKRKDPERPCHVFKRIYGILVDKKVSGLLEKFSFLCEAAMGKYPTCLQMDKLTNAFCEVSIERNGDHITFKMPCDILLTSSEPLKRIASLQSVDETENIEIPNIHPLSPTLDLAKCEDKPPCMAIPPFSNKHIHTLILGQKTYDEWLPKHMLATAIATCFSFSAKEAQMKYGMKVGRLPEPITVQCVFMDVKSMNFLVYQLNTLDLDGDQGVKNQAWVDEPTELYSEVSEIHPVQGYNPMGFSKMLAMYLNGLRPPLSL